MPKIVNSALSALLALVITVSVAQLTPESVSEGPCIQDYGDNIATNINKTWLREARDYYIPVGSEAYFRGWAKTLLGRYANTEKEVSEMGLRVLITSVGSLYTFKVHGYDNRYVYQSCPAINEDNSEILCKPIRKPHCSTSGTNTSSLITTLDTIVYIDNKTFLLVVQCVNNKVRVYKALTVTPTLNSKSMTIIKKKIVELGFDPELLAYQTY